MPSDEPSGSAKAGQGFAALRHRDFAICLGSRVLTFTAHHMNMAAIFYQVYDVTGSALALAYVSLTMIGPILLFAIVTGYASDRFDRRTVLILSYFCLCVSTAGVWWLSASGLAGSAWLYAVLLLMGTVRAFGNPAVNAIVPTLVPIEDLPSAIAWNTTINKIAQIGGPALGGFIYLISPEAVYATSTAFFAVGTLGIFLIRPRGAGSTGKAASLGEMVAGLVYVYRKKLLLGAVLLDLTVVLSASVHAVLPIIAKDVLLVGAAGAGALRAAMAFGGLLSALTMTQVNLKRAGIVMFMGDVIICLAAILMGLSTWFPLSFLAMAIIGAADMISVNIRNVLIQVATPNDMRGRVTGAASIAGSSGNELGGFRASLVAAFIGIVPAIFVGGAVGLAVVAICWKSFPDLARLKRIDQTV